MALFTTKGPDIPKGYIPLSRKDAVQFQLGLFETLAPPRYRFFVEYGPTITAFLSGATNIATNALYRKSLNIKLTNRLYTFVPLTLAPTFIVFGLHQRFVRDNIIIQKWACPYCYHLRSSFIQLFFGLIFPVASSAVASLATARQLKLPDVPPMNHTAKAWKFIIEKTRPFSRSLLVFACVNIIVGAAVAHAEAAENNYFNSNIETFISEYNESEKSKLPEKEKQNKFKLFP